MSDNQKTHPRISWTFDEYTNSEIRRAAATGIYDIRGGGSKRKLPHFDDLLFLGQLHLCLDLPLLVPGALDGFLLHPVPSETRCNLSGLVHY
mgnify:CR=1 FL=1